MSLKFDFDNLGELSFGRLKSKLEMIKKIKSPAFAMHQPDFERFYEAAEKYRDLEKVIICGRGGSTTSTKALWRALGELVTTKKVYFLESTDSNYIDYLKKRCEKEKTLFIAISKSGNTVDVIENLMSFWEYPTRLLITENKKSALKEIQEKAELDYIEHPQIGGRYSAVTSCALAPLAILHVPVDAIFKGIREMHKKCSPAIEIEDNPALKLSVILYLLDKKGYDEVYMPMYSRLLDQFAELVMQLMHESVGKKGKGQTYLALPAPQCQHHTNQRFFGGKKNMLGLFVRVEDKSEERIKVPEDLKDIKLKNSKLSILDNIPLSKTMEFEYQGTMEDATKNGIPNATITLDGVGHDNFGALIGFFHYLAVYSSLLREVNPFDQPQVEASKKISFELRKSFGK